MSYPQCPRCKGQMLQQRDFEHGLHDGLHTVVLLKCLQCGYEEDPDKEKRQLSKVPCKVCGVLILFIEAYKYHRKIPCCSLACRLVIKQQTARVSGARYRAQLKAAVDQTVAAGTGREGSNGAGGNGV